jgi:transposase
MASTQVVCSLVRGVTRSKGNSVSGTTVKFNVPRNCKTFDMKKFFFVELGIYPGRRVATPIRKNRGFLRFQSLLKAGWTCKTYGLTPSIEIVAYLSKEEKELQPQRNVLGIDINAKNFAYSVLSPDGRILEQGYLGQQMRPKKRHFEERRAMLQSFRALKKLKRIRHRQRDHVKTFL